MARANLQSRLPDINIWSPQPRPEAAGDAVDPWRRLRNGSAACALQRRWLARRHRAGGLNYRLGRLGFFSIRLSEGPNSDWTTRSRRSMDRRTSPRSAAIRQRRSSADRRRRLRRAADDPRRQGLFAKAISSPVRCCSIPRCCDARKDARLAANERAGIERCAPRHGADHTAATTPPVRSSAAARCANAAGAFVRGHFAAVPFLISTNSRLADRRRRNLDTHPSATSSAPSARSTTRTASSATTSSRASCSTTASSPAPRACSPTARRPPRRLMSTALLSSRPAPICAARAACRMAARCRSSSASARSPPSRRRRTRRRST